MTDDLLNAPAALPRGEYGNGLAGVSGPDLDPADWEHLPDPLRAMVQAVADVRAVPTSATVALALAALGGACGGIARVHPYPDRPAAALQSLKMLRIVVASEFTAGYNAVTADLDPTATPLDDAVGAGGTLGTLVNYQGQIGGHAERLCDARFVGPCIRSALSANVG